MFFFLPNFDKAAIKNNPFMELRSIFYKTVKRNKLKVWEFWSQRFNSFSAIKKTVTSVEGDGVRFVLIIIFVCTHKFPI